MDMNTELLVQYGNNYYKQGKLTTNEVVKETINYVNVPNGVKLHIVGRLKDTANQTTIATVEKDVTSNGLAEQIAEIEYKYDSRNLAGHTLSSVVVMRVNDNNVFIHNNALTDEKETIYYMNGRTSAKDKLTNIQLGADIPTTITDIFTVQNLVKGTTYKVVGTVHKRNAETGLDDGVLKDANNQEISKTITVKVNDDGTITAKDGNTTLTTTNTENANGTVNGTITIDFTVDGSLLRGVTTTLFEKVSIDNIEIFAHADINDKGQQVHFMDISTKLRDSVTKDAVAIRKADDKIVDTITFIDVPVNTTIKFNGILMNKATKESLKIGTNEVKSSATLVVDGNGQTTSSGATITKFDTETNTVSGNKAVGHDDEGNKSLFDFMADTSDASSGLDQEDMKRLWKEIFAELEDEFEQIHFDFIPKLVKGMKFDLSFLNLHIFKHFEGEQFFDKKFFSENTDNRDLLFILRS